MAIAYSRFRSLWYDIKKYYGFKPEEIRGILAGVIVIAFVLSASVLFTDYATVGEGWRVFWLTLFNSSLIVLLSFLVHISAQRLMALFSGFKVEYRYWMYGLGLALVLAIVSRGKLWFIAPGGIVVYHMAGHRLGSFRYGLNLWPLGLVGLAGPIGSVVLAVFFKILLYISPGNALLMEALVFNIWYAIITMLPIPPMDGSHMFFSSRLMYVFVYGFIIGLGVSLYFFNVLLSLGLGVLLAIILWQASYWLFEK